MRRTSLHGGQPQALGRLRSSVKRRAGPCKRPSRSDLFLLCSLDVELPYLRKAIRLGEAIATSETATLTTHPVIKFTFERAQEHVVERLLLRSAEGLELLDKAISERFHQTLFAGRGGKREPTQPALALAHRLGQD